MARIIGIVGLGGGFLVISPALRESAAGFGIRAQTYLAEHGPYSYGLIAAAALGIMFLFARSAHASR